MNKKDGNRNDDLNETEMDNIGIRTHLKFFRSDKYQQEKQPAALHTLLEEQCVQNKEQPPQEFKHEERSFQVPSIYDDSYLCHRRDNENNFLQEADVQNIVDTDHGEQTEPFFKEEIQPPRRHYDMQKALEQNLFGVVDDLSDLYNKQTKHHDVLRNLEAYSQLILQRKSVSKSWLSSSQCYREVFTPVIFRNTPGYMKKYSCKSARLYRNHCFDECRRAANYAGFHSPRHHLESLLPGCLFVKVEQKSRRLMCATMAMEICVSTEPIDFKETIFLAEGHSNANCMDKIAMYVIDLIKLYQLRQRRYVTEVERKFIQWTSIYPSQFITKKSMHKFCFKSFTIKDGRVSAPTKLLCIEKAINEFNKVKSKAKFKSISEFKSMRHNYVFMLIISPVLKISKCYNESLLAGELIIPGLDLIIKHFSISTDEIRYHCCLKAIVYISKYNSFSNRPPFTPINYKPLEKVTNIQYRHIRAIPVEIEWEKREEIYVVSYQILSRRYKHCVKFDFDVLMEKAAASVDAEMLYSEHH